MAHRRRAPRLRPLHTGELAGTQRKRPQGPRGDRPGLASGRLVPGASDIIPRVDTAILIAIAATVLTASAVFVNAWQLRVARIAAGGLAWHVQWSVTHTDDPPVRYTAKVRLVGPGMANDVKVMLHGSDHIAVPLETHRQVTATTEPIKVEFSVKKGAADKARLVILWSKPTAKGTRIEAVRFVVDDMGEIADAFEEWRWYRTARTRAWYRRHRTPVSRYVNGAPVKPLGKWKAKTSWSALPGEGPMPTDDGRYNRTLILQPRQVAGVDKLADCVCHEHSMAYRRRGPRLRPMRQASDVRGTAHRRTRWHAAEASARYVANSPRRSRLMVARRRPEYTVDDSTTVAAPVKNHQGTFRDR